MSVAGIVRVLFQGDTSGLDDAAKSAMRQLNSVQRSVMALRGGMEKGFKIKASSMGTSAADINSIARPLQTIKNLMVGGLAIEGFRKTSDIIRDVVMAASDLNEQVSATGPVFGSSASKVVSAANDMGKRFGIVKSEFLQTANALGGILKASGFTSDQAADMSIKFTKLAADLQSFKDISFEESVQKIRAGLVGEIEPLRSVGVLLSEGVVKQEAYSSGLAKIGAELTEGQKVQARARVITKQLSDAMGDLERTQGSVSNRSKEVRGRIINLAADMGQALRPISESILSGIALSIAKVSGLFDGAKGSVEQWAQNSVKQGGLVYKFIEGVGLAVGGLADGFVDVYNAMLPTIKLTAIGYAWALKMKSGLDELAGGNGSKSLIESRKVEDWLIGGGVKGMDKGAGENIRKFFKDIANGASQATPYLKTMEENVTGMTTEALKLADSFDDLSKDLATDLKTFGMSDDMKKLLALAEKGVPRDKLMPLAEGIMRKGNMERTAKLQENFADEFVSRLSENSKKLNTTSRINTKDFVESEIRFRSPAVSDTQKDIAKSNREALKELQAIKGILAGAKNPTVVGV